MLEFNELGNSSPPTLSAVSRIKHCNLEMTYNEAEILSGVIEKAQGGTVSKTRLRVLEGLHRQLEELLPQPRMRVRHSKFSPGDIVSHSKYGFFAQIKKTSDDTSIGLAEVRILLRTKRNDYHTVLGLYHVSEKMLKPATKKQVETERARVVTARQEKKMKDADVEKQQAREGLSTIDTVWLSEF